MMFFVYMNYFDYLTLVSPSPSICVYLKLDQSSGSKYHTTHIPRFSSFSKAGLYLVDSVVSNSITTVHGKE